MQFEARAETWPYATPFRITNFEFTAAEVLVVTLRDGERLGRGEAGGVYYRGETGPVLVRQVEAYRTQIEADIDRQTLRAIMPAGGARNAVDAALWELEAKRSGQPVWRLAGLGSAPKPIVTTFTIGADSPEAMADKARSYAGAKSIKVKLTGDLPLDLARVAAIRAARPDVWLGVDGNQG